MANASLEDCQLFAQSEILQRDLFIAAKDQEDHPKKREDCVQHEAESVSASSLKINRFRNRWNSGEAHLFQSGAYAINDLIRPASVIFTHVNEAATEGGKLKANTQTAALMKQVKTPAYLAISERTMDF